MENRFELLQAQCGRAIGQCYAVIEDVLKKPLSTPTLGVAISDIGALISTHRGLLESVFADETDTKASLEKFMKEQLPKARSTDTIRKEIHARMPQSTTPENTQLISILALLVARQIHKLEVMQLAAGPMAEEEKNLSFTVADDSPKESHPEGGAPSQTAS